MLTLSGIFYALWHCFHDWWLHFHLHFVILIINAWVLHPNSVLLFIVKCAVVRFTHEASYRSGWWVKPHNAKLNHACVHLTDALTQSDLHGIYGAFHHRMFPGIRLYLAHLCLCISQKRSCGLLGICSMRAGDDDGQTPASSAWCQQETGGDLAGRAAVIAAY